MANKLKRVVSTVLCATVMLTMTAVPGAVFAQTDTDSSEQPETTAQTENQATTPEHEAEEAAQETKQTPEPSQETAQAPAKQQKAAAQPQASKNEAKVATQAARERSVSLSASATTSKCNQPITLTANPSEFITSNSNLIYEWYYKESNSSKAQELTGFGNRRGKTSWTATKSGIYYVTVYSLVTPSKFVTSKEVAITINGHDSIEKVSEKSATCTENGNIAHYKCKDCGTLFSDQAGTQVVTADSVVIQKHGLKHVAKEDATCTKDGYQEYWKCNDESCGKLFKDAKGTDEIQAPEKIEATGHTVVWHYAGNNDEQCAKYCNVCKKFLSEPMDHEIAYKKGNDTNHLKYCKRCNANLQSEAHIWDADYTVDKEATCTEAGSKSKHCSKCEAITDVTAIPAEHKLIKHDFTPATCTEDGNLAYWKCSKCKKLFKNDDATFEFENKEATVIPAAHDWEDHYTVDKAPTCTEVGSKSIHCKNCEATMKEELIPAAGHDVSDVDTSYTPEKPPTCTEDGYEGYWTCKTCGKLFADEGCEIELSEPKIIPATGHKFGEWTVKKPAGIGTEGLKERVCEKCRYTETAAIPALEANKADLNNKTELAQKTAEKKTDKSAKTGDDSSIALYALLALLAAGGACGTVYRRKLNG